MIKAHQLMTRFLIRASFGDKADPKQVDMVNSNRRIGVGHFGVQGFLNKLGIKFSNAPKSNFYPDLLGMLYAVVRNEARDYSFQLRIPEPVKVSTVAPTGTIAKLVGATEGIHPTYAKYFLRRIRFSTINQAEKIQEFIDQGYEVEDCIYSANTKVVTFPTKDLLVEQVEALGFDSDKIVEAANEISLEDMLAFQAMYQTHYVDNAVSFTVNVPEGAYSIEDTMNTLLRYLPQLKGTTIMVDGTRPQAPYERISKTHYNYLSGPKSVEDSTDEDCASGSCPIR
jgi:adenosylcobalamin-dependent ribonucleoside-triphosphate reductase